MEEIKRKSLPGAPPQITLKLILATLLLASQGDWVVAMKMRLKIPVASTVCGVYNRYQDTKVWPKDNHIKLVQGPDDGIPIIDGPETVLIEKCPQDDTSCQGKITLEPNGPSTGKAVDKGYPFDVLLRTVYDWGKFFEAGSGQPENPANIKDQERCTGFFYSPSVILTATECIQSARDAAKNTQIRFSAWVARGRFLYNWWLTENDEKHGTTVFYEINNSKGSDSEPRGISAIILNVNRTDMYWPPFATDTKNYRALEVSKEKDFYDRTGFFAGWGKMKPGIPGNPVAGTHILQDAGVHILKSGDDVIDQTKVPENLLSEIKEGHSTGEVFVGYTTNRTRGCYGDQGAAFVCTSEGTHKLCGVKTVRGVGSEDSCDTDGGGKQLQYEIFYNPHKPEDKQTEFWTKLETEYGGQDASTFWKPEADFEPPELPGSEPPANPVVTSPPGGESAPAVTQAPGGESAPTVTPPPEGESAPASTVPPDGESAPATTQPPGGETVPTDTTTEMPPYATGSGTTVEEESVTPGDLVDA